MPKQCSTDRLYTLRYEGASHGELVKATMEELRLFQQRARVPLLVFFDVLGELHEEIEDRLWEQCPSWAASSSARWEVLRAFDTNEKVAFTGRKPRKGEMTDAT